jgi:hypothetical protein
MSWRQAQGERALRKRCRKLLRDLDVRPPLDVAVLCERIGEYRGKPIQLLPHPIEMPGPFGAWIRTPDTDYIVYQQETSRSHQDHIVLHELGHILAEHASTETSAVPPLHPGIDPDLADQAMLRTAYADEQEREAETVATIILEWASVLNAVTPPENNTRSAAQRRITDALSDSRGWL